MNGITQFIIEVISIAILMIRKFFGRDQIIIPDLDHRLIMVRLLMIILCRTSHLIYREVNHLWKTI